MYITKTCDDCGGSGKRHNQRCSTCKGTGKVKECDHREATTKDNGYSYRCGCCGHFWNAEGY